MDKTTLRRERRQIEQSCNISNHIFEMYDSYGMPNAGDTSQEEEDYDDRQIHFILPADSSDSDVSEKQELYISKPVFRDKKSVVKKSKIADLRKVQAEEYNVKFVEAYDTLDGSEMCTCPTRENSMNNTCDKCKTSEPSFDDITISETGRSLNFIVSANDSDSSELFSKQCIKESNNKSKKHSLGIREKLKLCFQSEGTWNLTGKKHEDSDKTLNGLDMITTVNSSIQSDADSLCCTKNDDDTMPSSSSMSSRHRWQSQQFTKSIPKAVKRESPGHTPSRLNKPRYKCFLENDFHNQVYNPWKGERFVLFKHKPDLNSLGLSQECLSAFDALKQHQEFGKETPSGWMFVPMPVFRYPIKKSKRSQKCN